MSEAGNANAENAVAHFDAVAPGYSALYEEHTSVGYALRVRRQRVLDILGPDCGKVLDVGCGPGVMVGPLLERGCTFWGVDPSVRMIEAAREAFSSTPGAQFSVGGAESLAFPDQFFDVVVCMGVIERLDDDAAALREMARVLKIGGSLVVTMPNRYSPNLLWRDQVFYPVVALLRPAYRLLKRQEQTPVVRGKRRYSRRSYAATMARQGCEVVDAAYCVYNVFLAPLDAALPGLGGAVMRRAEVLHRTPLRALGGALIVKAEKRALVNG